MTVGIRQHSLSAADEATTVISDVAKVEAGFWVPGAWARYYLSQ